MAELPAEADDLDPDAAHLITTLEQARRAERSNYIGAMMVMSPVGLLVLIMPSSRAAR